MAELHRPLRIADVPNAVRLVAPKHSTAWRAQVRSSLAGRMWLRVGWKHPKRLRFTEMLPTAPPNPGQFQSPPEEPSSHDELSATPKSFPPMSSGVADRSSDAAGRSGWLEAWWLPSVKWCINASPATIPAPTAAPVARPPRIPEPSPPAALPVVGGTRPPAP